MISFRSLVYRRMFSHSALLIVVLVLVVLSVFIRPTTREFFEDKPMSEETGSTEKNEPSAMDQLQEIRKILKCDGNIELKDPEIMLNTIATLLQCKSASTTTPASPPSTNVA